MAVEIEHNRAKNFFEQGVREGLLILCVTFAVYLIIALVSYHPADPGWTSTGQHKEVANMAGPVGAWIADVLLYFFGYVAFFIPMFFILKAIQLFKNRHEKRPIEWLVVALRGVGALLLSLATSLLLAVYSVAGLGPKSGGVLGNQMAELGVSTLNTTGSTLLAVAFWLIGFSLTTGLSWLKIMDWIGSKTLRGLVRLKGGVQDISSSTASNLSDRADQKAEKKKEKAQKKVEAKKQKEAKQREEEASKKERVEPKLDEPPRLEVLPAPEYEQESAKQKRGFLSLRRSDPKKEEMDTVIDVEEVQEEGKKIKISPFQKKPEGKSKRAKKDSQRALFKFIEGPLPPITLLDPPDANKKGGFSKEVLENLSELLENKLADFGVIAEVVEVSPGPVITRFEIQPAPGIKVSRISNLAKDLARSMAMISVRVVEVIPGKSVVGIEVPNENRQMVRLREVLSSPAYDNADSALSLGLGNDIAGNPVVENLAKMPHLLVAGTTGSGKSVGVNAMLISMLFKAKPDELRLIMIDPKMLGTLHL